MWGLVQSIVVVETEVGAKEMMICRGKPSREFATIPRQLRNLRNKWNRKPKFSVCLLKLTLNTKMVQA